MVDADQDLAQQAHGDQLHAHQGQHHAEQQERATADVFAEKQFLDNEDTQRQQAGQEQGNAGSAEGVHRTVQKTQQKLHPEQVENHAQGAVDAVLGLAVHAGVVGNRHFDDLGAELCGERRNETVQLAVDFDVADAFAAVNLERAAVIVEVDAGHARNQAVGDHRGQLAVDVSVLAVFAPAGNDVDFRPLIEHVQQAGNVGRVVLQIAVEGDDHGAGCRVEAGLHRRRLAVVANQVKRVQPGAGGGELFQQRGGSVGRAIIDANQLPGAAGGFHRLADPAQKLCQIFFLVVNRNNNGNVEGGRRIFGHDRGDGWTAEGERL